MYRKFFLKPPGGLLISSIIEGLYQQKFILRFVSPFKLVESDITDYRPTLFLVAEDEDRDKELAVDIL